MMGMSFWRKLTGLRIPDSIEGLIEVCEELCDRRKFGTSIELSEAYADRLFADGDLTSPAQFYELAVTHLLAMAAAFEQCESANERKLVELISAIAGRRRFVQMLLERAEGAPKLAEEIRHKNDVASAIMNGLIDKYRDRVDVEKIILKSDMTYHANFP
ncbi:MAG: hypothetical protein H6918_04390 [Sphingomonadaceae bacterium]|nr:hypothetical protein [Sphingomonadaceae bacterium]